MALKFKLTNRTLNVNGKETPLHYATSMITGVTDQQQVISLTEKISAVSSGDVKSVLDTLSTILVMELQAGRAVDLGDLGRFRMTAHSKAAPSAESFSRENLLTPRIVFVPGKSLREARKSATYSALQPLKVQSGGTSEDPEPSVPGSDPDAGGSNPTPKPGGGGE